MSLLEKFMAWISGGKKEQMEEQQSIPENKPTRINYVNISSFFKSELAYRMDNHQLVSSVYTVNYEMMNRFPISAENKIFDMRLRNEQHQILNTMKAEDMTDENFAILMNHMKVTSYTDIYPDLYRRLFSGKGDRFSVAYCLAMKKDLEDILDEMTENFKIRKLTANKIYSSSFSGSLINFYREILRLMRVLSQVYPAFALDLIQLNVFEEFFKKVNKEVVDIIRHFPQNSEVILEAHNELLNLSKNFLIRVMEEEAKLKGNANGLITSKGDFREALFMKALVKNSIVGLPFDEFGDEVNALLQETKKNLFNVSMKYIENDLSNEVPKMFEDVLSDMIKNFLSMPKDFRKTMSNSSGKTVEMMLIDVLNVINARLKVISEESHQEALREVSILDEFSQNRWQTTS